MGPACAESALANKRLSNLIAGWNARFLIG
jgi:hypothetical protein